jgi:hypothetical protein
VAINKEIAEILYEGDDVAETIYTVKQQFYPFNGLTPDDIAMLMGSQYVSEFTKVLYANFEAIFNDINMEDPAFWWWNLDKQWKKVEDMTNQYMDEISSGMQNDLKITNPPGFPDPSNPDNPPAPELKPGDPGYTPPTP